jgi:hypothetical protein
MMLYELAQKINAEVLAPSRSLETEIERFYAGDKISELLNLGCGRTLVVSEILDPHLFRVTGLLDIPAICLLNHYLPEQDLLTAARENKTILLISPVDKSETTARLASHLGRNARIDHEGGG